MEGLGKKLYKSSALPPFKIAYLSIAGLLLLNLVLQTLGDEYFMAKFETSFGGLASYFATYPEDLIVYIGTIFIPAIYYSFVRGIVFCQNGMIINRGLPFFNRNVLYKDISHYKIIHPRFLMSITRADIGEELVFTIRSMDRVIAIFDQHNIPGDLGKENFSNTMTVNIRLLVIFIIFGVVLFAFQHFGGLARLLR